MIVPTAAGVYKGRQASIDAAQVRKMKAQGIGASEVAKALGIGRASVYRGLEGDSITWGDRESSRRTNGGRLSSVASAETC